jgi:hypothetical protein
VVSVDNWRKRKYSVLRVVDYWIERLAFENLQERLEVIFLGQDFEKFRCSGCLSFVQSNKFNVLRCLGFVDERWCQSC